MKRRTLKLSDGREVHVTAWEPAVGYGLITATVIGQKRGLQCRFDLDRTRALALAEALRRAAGDVGEVRDA
jgi:hypothetical protein